MSLDGILSKNLFKINDYQVDGYHIVISLFIVLITIVILRLFRKLIKRQIHNNKIDKGKGLAIYQIIKYVVVIFSILIILDTLGIKITLVLAGSAALLVGLGLGLQQLFNDLVSGVFLLFEGIITVGDVIEIDGLIGKVKDINLRTSNVESRSGITIIVPNSKLVNDKVVNWSHNRGYTRFSITVGVAYGSDLKLVKKLLMQAAKEHEEVVSEPFPMVRFDDFGDSSLDFQVFFWSNNMFGIESIRSDVRFRIDELFRENHVSIPFPQRDLHFKSTEIPLNEAK